VLQIHAFARRASRDDHCVVNGKRLSGLFCAMGTLGSSLHNLMVLLDQYLTVVELGSWLLK